MASVLGTRQQHALAIPAPAQGHRNALMRFCNHLASHDFLITFVDTDPVHHRIQQLHLPQDSAAAEAADSEGEHDSSAKVLGNIRRIHVPIDGFDLSNEFRFSFVPFFEAMQGGFAPHLEQLLQRLSLQEPPLTCLISDFFLTAASSKLALQFNLPRIVFCPFSASLLLFMDYVLCGDIPQDQVVDAAKKRGKGALCEGLPGLPALNREDVLVFKHLEDSNEFMYELTSRELQESKSKGHAMVVNTAKELENEALEVLAKHLKIPVYPVGPLVKTIHEVETATSLWKEDITCMRWLDQQAPLSVLYVSFGSIAFFSKLQFEELVGGLLSSQCQFLFVFRRDFVEHDLYSSTSSSLLQSLFSSERGYVVEWTPQLAVLSHPSVGGFLTHCGLNSTLEALVHGVPMLCWPYFGDQFMNAKFIVQQWKVGLAFSATIGPHGSFITREEVEKRIQELMEGEDGKRVRENSKILKELAFQSISPSGTSTKSLQDLIQSLRQQL